MTNGFFMRIANTLIRLGGCPGWSDSSLGARVILMVVVFRLNYRNLNIWRFLDCFLYVIRLHALHQRERFYFFFFVAFLSYNDWLQNQTLRCFLSFLFTFISNPIISKNCCGALPVSDNALERLMEHWKYCHWKTVVTVPQTYSSIGGYKLDRYYSASSSTRFVAGHHRNNLERLSPLRTTIGTKRPHLLIPMHGQQASSSLGLYWLRQSVFDKLID